MSLRFKIKISPKTFGTHCVFVLLMAVLQKETSQSVTLKVNLILTLDVNLLFVYTYFLLI
jgi:hypothetical protein